MTTIPEIKARIKAIAATSADIEKILTGREIAIAAADLPALEVLVRRSRWQKIDSNTYRRTCDFALRLYVAEVTVNDEATEIAALEEAEALMDMLPQLFLNHSRLQLDDAGLLNETLFTDDVGPLVVPYKGKRYSAIGYVLPIVTELYQES